MSFFELSLVRAVSDLLFGGMVVINGKRKEMERGKNVEVKTVSIPKNPAISDCFPHYFVTSLEYKVHCHLPNLDNVG